ncbi:hypothetical protein [Hanstruepera marina]|uniref:hypothetical protein n=1 Tax=Hanstruepera marina TaxID=2873265 RepID=UPI001CA6AA92|nr:hypothetical protein [Hanstruepera marina]
MKTILFSLFAVLILTNTYSQSREAISINGKNLDLPPQYIAELQNSYLDGKHIKYSYYMNLARESLLKKEFHKTLYYLQYTREVDSPEYWFYLGITVLQEGSIDACKKYLKKGLMDLGCWECGEAYEKLFEEEIKYMHNLLRDVKTD